MLNAWIFHYIVIFVVTNSLNALQYSSEKKSYEQAIQDCYSTGGRLVKIDSISKFEIIKTYIQQKKDDEDVWTDLRSEGEEYDVYRHSDGEVATLFRWDTEEPDYRKTDRCVRIRAQTLKYRTIRCHNIYHFICETSEMPETFTQYTQPVSTDDCEVCDCSIHYSSLNDPTVMEAMKERIQDIKQILSLNKSDLSKQVRRKISAPDERMSSTLLGCVGVVFLVFSIGVIVIPDTMKLIKYMKGKLKTTN